MAALELTPTRRRGPRPRNTSQRRSSPRQWGEVQGRRTRNSTRAHLSNEARSGAEGHVVAPELTPTVNEVRSRVTCGSAELHGTWQRVNARSARCLDLKLVSGGTRFAGYRQF
jgi:hypothetical protein